MFGCKIIFILLPLVVYCSAHYIKIDGRTYYVSTPIKRNWFKANQYCELLGMNFLDIRTEEEFRRVKRVVSEFQMQTNNTEGTIYWTSGSDLGDESRFYWLKTGIPIEFSHWRSGQPDNYEDSSGERENCLQFIPNTLEWNDMTCSTKYSFICRDTLDVPQYKNNIGSC